MLCSPSSPTSLSTPHQGDPDPGVQVLGWDAERVVHCWIRQLLTFPPESPLVPPGFPHAALLDHRKVAGLVGLCLQEGKREPEGTPLLPRAPQSHRTPNGHTACLLQSHFPQGGERRKQPVTWWSLAIRSLWTWSQQPGWTEKHLSPDTFQEGLAGHCVEEGAQPLRACPQEAQGQWPEKAPRPVCMALEPAPLGREKTRFQLQGLAFDPAKCLSLGLLWDSTGSATPKQVYLLGLEKSP